MTAGQTGNFIDFIQNSGRGASELQNSYSTQSFAGLQSGDLTYFDASMSAKGGNGKGGSPFSGSSTETVTYTYTTGLNDDIDDDLQYNIEIQFVGELGDGVGEWSTELIKIFEAAADYLASLVAEGITAATDSSGALYADLTITADLANIDGGGGVLGRAGPTAIWTASELTALGEMTFDQADVDKYLFDGSFDDIVLHEMMHVMGVGTLWGYKDLVSTTVVDNNGTKKPTDDTIESVFEGDAANAVYNPDGIADVFLFVETDGGSGTAGGHWDEQTYDNELMTGYIDDTNYLSDWSVASLADLGYKLELDADGLPGDVVLV